MDNILRALRSINPSAIYCYIDTIELFFQRRPKGVGKIRTLQNGRAWLEPCCDRNGFVWGHRLIVQQPMLRTIPELHRMQNKYKAALRRLDVAADVILPTSDERQAFKSWSKKSTRLRWRPPGDMYDEGDFTGWVSYAERKQLGKKHCRRDLEIYGDKHCKITGEECVHIELRLLTAASVTSAGYRQVRDLPALNPHRLLKKHIKLVDFDPEALKQKYARAAVNADRRRYRGRTTTPFSDRFRASIPHRIRGWIERFTQDRAQLVKDFLSVELKPVDFDLLRLPDHLEWVQPHDKSHTHPIPTKLPCDFNTPTQEVTMQHQ